MIPKKSNVRSLPVCLPAPELLRSGGGALLHLGAKTFASQKTELLAPAELPHDRQVTRYC